MKHSTLKNIVLPGIFCAACLGASVWYSVVFNHSRLIAPTDFSTYVFRVQDLPLMLACSLCAVFSMRNSKKAPPPPAPLTRGLVFWGCWAF